MFPRCIVRPGARGLCDTPVPAANARRQIARLHGGAPQAEGDVAAAGDDVSKSRSAWGMLATEQSIVGDTERAIESFRTSRIRTAVKSPADGLTDPEVRGALDAILEAVARPADRDDQRGAPRAARSRVCDARGARAAQLGFRYLAMETLPEPTAAIAARGYPPSRRATTAGDPVFGDFIRRALAEGYTPLRTSTTQYESGCDSAVDCPTRGKQARNLVDLILAKDPGRELLVHVGYGHLRTGAMDAKSSRSQNAHGRTLAAKTGIDPYCIDQTQALPANESVLAAVFDEAPGRCFVVEARDAECPYSESPSVDMNVYHQPTRMVNGRPDWLSMDGYRNPRAIPVTLLPKTGRRLVQAFVARESADAVPIDQVLVAAGARPPMFMLPKGKFRFAFQD